IQADLKAFSALGTFGTSVITALVAQNTRGVDAVHEVPQEFVAAQLESLFTDVRIDAVKIGMLGNASTVRCVSKALRHFEPSRVVLDPVMVAQSGDRLLKPEAVAALRDELLPQVDLITPNLPEAAVLLEEPEARDEGDMHDQLDRLGKLSARVLLKGGHLPGRESIDLLLADGAITRLSKERLRTRNTHGTGCTLSAAVTALRPQRPDWTSAVAEAKDYLTDALAASDQLDVGHGHGPQQHFHAWWPSP
ncbi:MAG: bifunctional hydroxymethylpyrimidine kinase/phosphomethylpyrimidine kinase, partial [Nocardioidaceae bacterium]